MTTEHWDPPAHTGKTFPKHPAGSFRVVLADALRLGTRVNDYKGDKKLQDRVVLLFQSEEEMPDDGRFELAAEFTYSASDKATLPKFLAKWLGLPSGSDEERQKLVSAIPDYTGRSGIGTVVQNAVGDKVYVNLTAVAPLMKGMKPLKAEDYTRNEYWAKKKARYAEESAAFQQAPAPAVHPVKAASYEDVPPAIEAPEDDLPFS